MSSTDREQGGSSDGYQPQDAWGWPSAVDCHDAPGYADRLAQAKLDVRTKRADQEIAHAKADYEAALATRTARHESDLALRKAYYDAVFELARGSVDRARSAAEVVQKAAATIVTLYTGVLALAFSVSDNPLPWRAVLTALFLGLAIVLSTGFLAYLPEQIPQRTPTKDEEEGAPQQDIQFGDRVAARYIEWSNRAAIRRSYWLRASVVSLGVALFFLPAAFVDLGRSDTAGTATSWPALAADAPTDPELQKIVYSAQVAEVARLRTATARDDTVDVAWLGLAGLGLLWVAYVFVRGHVRHRSTLRSTGSSGPVKTSA